MILTDMLLGLIPAGLIVLAGILISNASSSEFKKRNLLLYWLGVGVLSLLAMWIAAQLNALGDYWSFFQVSQYLLIPSLIGVLALILINLSALLRLRGRALILASLLGLLTAALIIASLKSPDGTLYYVLPGALILSFTWAAARKTGSLPIVLSLLVLAFLAVLDPYSVIFEENLPYWLTFPIGVLFFSLPWICVALAGIMISAGLNKFSRSQKQAGDEAVPVYRFPANLLYALAGLLLSFLAYRIYWSSIWDHTRDGLAGLFFSMPAIWVAIGVGMVVSMKNARGQRLYGVAFAILVPIFIFGAFQRGWDVDYHALTEARAARIHTALEQFHHRNGRYPAELAELVPRDLLYVPQPVIFHGSGWCYQSRGDGYRLGAVYREYFGTPLSIKIYASDGEILDESWECTQQLSALKALYEPAPFFEQEINAPTEAALPTSQAHAVGEELEPVLHAEFLSWGDWSPGDRYLPISQVVSSQGGYFTALSFLDIESGEVCCAGQQFPVQSTPWAPRLRQHFAWTPSGNLLYLTPMGDLVELNPGEAGAASSVEDMQEPFVSIAAYHQETGRVLLQTAAAYWLMDSVSRSIRQIEAVKPNPDELHWDNSAWSPHGEWLAISQLNDRDETEGSTLYVLSGENGRLEKSLPMNASSAQSAPWIEWLSSDELLTSGVNDLLILDLNRQTPVFTRVIKDIFNLDLDYPDEAAAWGSVIAGSWGNYHLALRASLPRDQNLYVYHSETGEVEILHPEVHGYLIFPDGQSLEMPRFSFAHKYPDVYEIFWIDQPGKESRTLSPQGHSPRSYPSLSVRYLPDLEELAFGSSQGVSLVSLPEGKTLAFWRLSSGDGHPSLLATSKGQALIALREWVNESDLFYIPLPP